MPTPQDITSHVRRIEMGNEFKAHNVYGVENPLRQRQRQNMSSEIDHVHMMSKAFSHSNNKVTMPWQEIWRNNVSVKVFFAEIALHICFYLFGPFIAGPVILFFYGPRYTIAHGFLPPCSLDFRMFFFTVETTIHCLLIAAVLNFVWPPQDSTRCSFDVSLDVILPMIFVTSRLLVICVKYSFMQPNIRLHKNSLTFEQYTRRTLLSFWTGPTHGKDDCREAIDAYIPRTLRIPTAHLKLTHGEDGVPSFLPVWKEKLEVLSREENVVAIEVDYRDIAHSIFLTFCQKQHVEMLKKMNRVNNAATILYISSVLITKYLANILPFRDSSCSAHLHVLHVITLIVGAYSASNVSLFAGVLLNDLKRRTFIFQKMNELVGYLQLRSAHDVVNWSKGRNIMSAIGHSVLQRMGVQLVLFLFQFVMIAIWILTSIIARISESIPEATSKLNRTGTGSASSLTADEERATGIFPLVFYPTFAQFALLQVVIGMSLRQGAIANRQCVRQSLHWTHILCELSLHEDELSMDDPTSQRRGPSHRNKFKALATEIMRTSSRLELGNVDLPKSFSKYRSIESATHAVISELDHLHDLNEIRLLNIPLSWSMFQSFVGIFISEIVFVVTISTGLTGQGL